MRNQKTAIVFGSTGMIGSALIRKLIQEPIYGKVITIGRKKPDISHPKLVDHVVDLENDDLNEKIVGQDVFCCLGTTSAKVPDRAEYRRIELDIPLKIAQIARYNKVDRFIYISSVGANVNSKNFYLSLKGESEKALQEVLDQGLSIVRPSLLLGNRKEFRFGEFVSKLLFKIFRFVFSGRLKRFHAIKAYTLVNAMIRIASFKHGKIIYENEELLSLGKF